MYFGECRLSLDVNAIFRLIMSLITIYLSSITSLTLTQTSLK